MSKRPRKTQADPVAEDFDLEDFLPYRLFQAAEAASRGFHALYGQRYGLSRMEWRVLFSIGQYGPLSAVGISKAAGFHKTQISRAVAKLEARRWVERLPNGDDRRSHDVRLTRQGRAAFRELAALAKSYNDRQMADLGRAASEDLIRALRRIETGA